ncbi:MAG: LacI family DNA-binding transcriptional regulator [Pseudomonadota bacterium]
MKKRALSNLEDVAREARVSTATVSRCLNEPDKVSEKTRERVMKAVDKLHYAPNFGARAIAANRTGTFGAVIPTMDNAIFARGIEAFQKALVERNATMLVASSDYDPQREAKQIKTLVARGADGLLLIGFQRDPKIYEFLSGRGIPVVSAWNCSTDTRKSYVGFNNRKASRALVEQALALGHRSFGYIAAPTLLNDRSSDRLEGARDAINHAGMNAALMTVIETEYSIRNGFDAMGRILANPSPPRPTLVICGNDVLAVGAIQAAQDAGLNVPEDISVVGFDDIEISTVIKPTLTTVHVPHREMGRLAAETLFDLANDGQAPRQIELQTRIVMRESLANAP